MKIKGRIIRKFREQLGESQVQFAKRFNVTQTSLWRWELDNPSMGGPAALLFERIQQDHAEATDA